MEYSSPSKERTDTNPQEAALAGIGRRVFELRDARGWKQVVLARRAALRPARLSRIEKGRELPTLAEFLRLAAALEVRLEELAFGESRSASQLADLIGDVEALGAPEDVAALRKLLQAVVRGVRSAAGERQPGP